MMIVVQYTQDIMGMRCHSQYIDAYHAIIGRRVAGADSAAWWPVHGLYHRKFGNLQIAQAQL